MKWYGDTEKAHEAFLEHAKKCDPPLPDFELKTIWNSAVKFFRKSIVTQDGYVPPDEYNADFEGTSLKPEDYSDIGQAKVLVREYGDELKYTSATDFLRFDGECWREDKQMAIGAVEEFLDLQLQDAMDEVARVEKALEDAGVPKASIQAGPKELLKEVDGKLLPLVYMLMGAQTYLKFVQKRRDYKYIVSAANTAKPMLAISVSELDKDENLINTPYATYDLRKGLTGEQPHNPENLITKITACSPGEEGKQIWLDALDIFFCKDQKLIDYVQETVGMAAIGKVYQEHMIIAYGGGANGKSTFWNTIFRVLGNYAGKLSAEALTMNCKRNVKPEMAELKGKRLIISSEMEAGNMKQSLEGEIFQGSNYAWRCNSAKQTKHRYGRAWKRIRDKYASEHPFCELYFERGLAVPVEEIHHKLLLSEGGTHDRCNLIALCKLCHSQIHAKRGDRWG